MFFLNISSVFKDFKFFFMETLGWMLEFSLAKEQKNRFSASEGVK